MAIQKTLTALVAAASLAVGCDSNSVETSSPASLEDRYAAVEANSVGLNEYQKLDLFLATFEDKLFHGRVDYKGLDSVLGNFVFSFNKGDSSYTFGDFFSDISIDVSAQDSRFFLTNASFLIDTILFDGYFNDLFDVITPDEVNGKQLFAYDYTPFYPSCDYVKSMCGTSRIARSVNFELWSSSIYNNPGFSLVFPGSLVDYIDTESLYHRMLTEQ